MRNTKVNLEATVQNNQKTPNRPTPQQRDQMVEKMLQNPKVLAAIQKVVGSRAKALIGNSLNENKTELPEKI